MKNIKSPSLRRGFTLVELLVVIAIIATLAGLTIIAVRLGSSAGDSATLTSNMKNINTQLVQLKSEGVNTGHHAPGTYPPYEGSLQNQSRSRFVWWDLVAEKFTIADRDGTDFRWSQAYEDSPFQNPFSKKKLGAGKDDWDSLLDEPELSFGSYAMNGQLSDAVYADERADRVNIVRDNRIDDDTNTILFAECADTRVENDDTPGWVFFTWENAPQGNYKDQAHCMMVDGSLRQIDNAKLKDPDTFKFLTTPEEKNYEHEP
jgi:prepilin-type N-terminal cleavage/methylation domain-containing protein